MTVERGTVVPIKIPALHGGPVFLRKIGRNKRIAVLHMEWLTKYVEENGVYPTEDEIRAWHSSGGNGKHTE